MINLEKFLGRGTYGEVYKIKDRNSAMKQINIDPNLGLRELGELNLLRIVRHPNILKLEDFVITDTYLGMILPLAKKDLQFEQFGGINVDKWMYQLLSAIHFLHKNSYFHCDIKPANILIIKDNAILSDLGLTGNVMKMGSCQSIASPQLMVKRGSILKSPIARQPSNEYQDDIWALGVTFFYMLTGTYGDFLEPDKTDQYINSNRIDFLTDHVQEQYVLLLSILINPEPEARSLNLLELLAFPIFSVHRNYLDGNIISAINHAPVIFNDDVKTIFSGYIKKLRDVYAINKSIGMVVELPHIMLFNAIDMLYRIYETLKDANDNLTPECVIACFYISVKIYGIRNIEELSIAYKQPSTITRLLNYIYGTTNNILSEEVKIVKALDGYLSRNLVISYLSKSQYEKFLNWLENNPERYEQCSLDKLAEITRDMMDE
jgi:serine/threonine protein kinase